MLLECKCVLKHETGTHLQGFVYLLIITLLAFASVACVTIASHIDFMNLLLNKERPSPQVYKITLTTSFNVCTDTGVQLALCDFWLTTSMSSVLENWP